MLCIYLTQVQDNTHCWRLWRGHDQSGAVSPQHYHHHGLTSTRVMETSAWVHILIFIYLYYHCIVIAIRLFLAMICWWKLTCILCCCNRMHKMQYAIFDQNWEQNYWNSIAFLWIFLLSPVPTRHQKNISNIHACASPQIVTGSMSVVFSSCNSFYYILIIFFVIYPIQYLYRQECFIKQLHSTLILDFGMFGKEQAL